MTEEALPLTRFYSGKTVVLIFVNGGQGLRKRLTDMGLTEGTKFKILTAHRSGPYIVCIKETRLVLGYGMASKVLVREA